MDRYGGVFGGDCRLEGNRRNKPWTRWDTRRLYTTLRGFESILVSPLIRGEMRPSPDSAERQTVASVCRLLSSLESRHLGHSPRDKVSYSVISVVFIVSGLVLTSQCRQSSTSFILVGLSIPYLLWLLDRQWQCLCTTDGSSVTCMTDGGVTRRTRVLRL